MGKMIVDQSTISLAGMLLGSALLFIGSTFCYYIIKDEFKQRQSNRNWLTIIFNAIVFVVTFLAGVFMTYSMLLQSYQQEDLRHNDKLIKNYYTLHRDGKTLVADKKVSAPYWAANRAVVQIIDEDEKSYQIKYEEEYARIDKDLVK